jgi:hypothetical protein
VDCGLRIGISLIPQSEIRDPQSLSGSGRRAIARLQTRQAGNGATVADLGCAAASPEPDQLVDMKKHVKPGVKFVVCITDSEPDLEPRKVAQVIQDQAAEKENHLRVIDESGEDYLYPADFLRSWKSQREQSGRCYSLLKAGV